MTVSELISVLTELKNKHGDVLVIITVDWSSSIKNVTFHEADSHTDVPYIELM